MKKIKILYIVLLALLAVSCEDYLDETPDNRAEVDSQIKIRKLLVSAYPSGNPTLACELSSDNIEDTGESNPNTTRFHEQLASWVDVTETDNDDLKTVWEGCYGAIAHSNEALSAIEKLGEEELLAEKGEALITRAYAHFVLINIFSQHYNSATSSTDLGITYMEESETTLNPQYERGTVKETYEKINRDIEAALPLISDDMYEIASYHFTVKAAYGFAARFNLYYENWEKAAEYATIALGANPASSIRNWNALGQLPQDPEVVSRAYVDDRANLLATASTSSVGLYFGAYYYGSRYNHPARIASLQTLWAATPWATGGIARSNYEFAPFVYSGSNLDKTLFYKMAYFFEYTDPVAQVGYRKTVSVPFTTDEVLLVRAEANVMLNKNSEALADLNIWTRAFYKGVETTLDEIDAFYNSIAYSTPETTTTKKVLHPGFTVEAGLKENLIHYVLQCRRVLTLHEGLRWFDVKRYGIEVPRHQVQSDGSVKVLDILVKDDKRRALQIPQDVIAAGIEANPRK